MGLKSFLFKKLQPSLRAQMQLDEENCMVAFPCNCDHDAMMGMMLFRAQNVRAAMREEADAASRGVLAPPSQQE